MAKTYTVAVVGALGVVGTEMISTLERRNFPVSKLVPLDIASQVGKEVEFQGKKWVTKEAEKGAFEGVDIAIFSAGGEASELLAPIAVKEGAVVVDNSSQWRMDPNCPLVVPEVNPQDLDWHKGIIANPNCSTIQMLVALKPLHDAAKIKRVVVSTYQAVSGSGKKAIDGLRDEAEEMLKTGSVKKIRSYKKQIAFNCLPHIDVFQDGGYTKEEFKMVNETKKMLDPNIKVTATCVRVPVWYGHSEAINIETEKKLTADQARKILSKAESIKVVDDPASEVYPTPIMSDNEDLTMVGRIREDFTIANGLNLWVVSNNIRKGAALNAVQVAETLIQRNLV
ncbi:MAG: aspartate-semialdehyde dehydrogenase [Spirochaetales bacterium]|jgi:aspartate-semialdehyde dehydrogenase|nr:aspartate-semialdehyde dehydrogenase [Spirochaetales bacterium]